MYHEDRSVFVCMEFGVVDKIIFSHFHDFYSYRHFPENFLLGMFSWSMHAFSTMSD
jgi:hypothetical protein